MTSKNGKLLNAIANYLITPTVLTAQESYIRRFERLYHVMMSGVDALYDQERGADWFINLNYARLSMTDLAWISDEFDAVPNAEYGESVLEDVDPEDVWRDRLLSQRNGSTALLPKILQLPAVRTTEDFF